MTKRPSWLKYTIFDFNITSYRPGIAVGFTLSGFSSPNRDCSRLRSGWAGSAASKGAVQQTRTVINNFRSIVLFPHVMGIQSFRLRAPDPGSSQFYPRG